MAKKFQNNTKPSDINGKMQNKSHSDKIEILENHTNNTALTKEFIKTNENKDSHYNFGKLTEDNLKDSNFEENPSEIDKRTKILANYIRRAYITNFKY